MNPNQFWADLQYNENETEYYNFINLCHRRNIQYSMYYQLSKDKWQQLFLDLGFTITSNAAFAVVIDRYYFVFSKGVARTTTHWGEKGYIHRDYGPCGVLMFIYDTKWELDNPPEDCIIHRIYGGEKGVAALAARYKFRLEHSDSIPARAIRKYDGWQEVVHCKWDPDTGIFFDVPRPGHAAETLSVEFCLPDDLLGGWFSLGSERKFIYEYI